MWAYLLKNNQVRYACMWFVKACETAAKMHEIAHEYLDQCYLFFSKFKYWIKHSLCTFLQILFTWPSQKFHVINIADAAEMCWKLG